VGIGATHGRTWPAPEITDAECRFLCALTRDFTRKHSFGHYSEGNMGKHCRPFLFFPVTDHQIWGDFVEMTSSQSGWIGGKEIDGFFRLARREEAAWRAMQRRATQPGGKRHDLCPSIQPD
jgi:hypothetical protein